ncbi:MAG: ribonuclease III [archaeon]|nr:ribonuclease III [archaeon]
MKSLFEKFDIIPNNEQLYEIAFTHSSYGTSNNLNYNYERLEFLGDSILSMLVSEYLYKKYPKYEEGNLTKLRSNYVCQAALIYYSEELGLNNYIKYDLNEGLTQNEILSITADIFESFLGAIFLDQGIVFAKRYILKIIFKSIDDKKIFFYDYKSHIKEYGDYESIEISYQLLDEKGLPHDKTFTMSILLNGVEYGMGIGKTKKEAEQHAASEAMRKLGLGDF